jgi:hypothetical protein
MMSLSKSRNLLGGQKDFSSLSQEPVTLPVLESQVRPVQSKGQTGDPQVRPMLPKGLTGASVKKIRDVQI